MLPVSAKVSRFVLPVSAWNPVDRSTGVRSDQTVILGAIESAQAYPDPALRAPGADHRRDLPFALAGGAVLQVDQAALADQEVLRRQRERREDPELPNVYPIKTHDVNILRCLWKNIVAGNSRSAFQRRGHSRRPFGYRAVRRALSCGEKGEPSDADF